MRIKLTTRVRGNWKDVYARFDEELFRYLLPPGAKLNRFDGSLPGNLVDLSFTFPVNARWVSEIIYHEKQENAAWFIDKGVVLPFGLKYWRHRHEVRAHGQDFSIIEDNMEFSTGNSVLNVFYYPFLFLAFLPRKYQYKRFFNKVR